MAVGVQLGCQVLLVFGILMSKEVILFSFSVDSQITVLCVFIFDVLLLISDNELISFYKDIHVSQS